MSNHHLRNRELTLKAKGLISLMLSLPESWEYSLAGLAHICQDGIGSVRSGVAELEQHGYLTRRRIREANGQLGDVEYTIHEIPQKPVNNNVDNPQPTCDKPTLQKPICENPIQAKPIYGECTQLNTNQSSIQELNTHGLNIHQSIRSETPLPERQEIDTMDAIDIYRDILKENIEYDYLCQQYKYQSDEINEILELMLETVCSKRKTIRIGGEDKPAELVKSRMLKIDQSHIDYLMECLSKNTTDVCNIKNYLLTAIYNAPNSINNHYKARVNHDLYGDK